MSILCRFRMTEPKPGIATLQSTADASKRKQAQWPLSFRILPQTHTQLQHGPDGKPKRKWWSHLLYRGPNNEQVKILYSKTKADSEALAKQFLGEKVVGFDMEWPWNHSKLPNKLQNKVGLIQVATEDKIALFHIGLHTGITTNDIIAPSLRHLIESPSIGKIGVGILNADFARLSRYFKLRPKGAVELSHIHRLVTFGGTKPELVSTKMTSLAHQVEQHLKHPLYKGDVRTSNWSKPLSQEQIKYAAGDAYAGIMLYHCLNYKRLQMKPTPPMPIHAEKYLNYKLAGVGSLYLEPSEKGGKVMTSAFFFGVPTASQDLSSKKSKGAASGANKTTTSTARTKPISENANAEAQLKVCKVRAGPTLITALDGESQALHLELVKWRTAVAAEHSISDRRVFTDAVLLSLAKERPDSNRALLGVRGVGKQKEEVYGKRVLGVISSFLAGIGATTSSSNVDNPRIGETDRSGLCNTPKRSSKVRPETPESSPAFASPPLPRTPTMRTGLSFALADTKLEEEEESDDSLPSLDFGMSPIRGLSGQKRKRILSPMERRSSRSSPRPKTMLTEFQYIEGVSEQQTPRTTVRKRSSVQAGQGKVLPMPISQTKSSTAQPLTPQSRIVRNRLSAFSKLVAAKKKTKADAIVSDETLEAMARNPPRTHDELRCVPGVEKFFAACVDADFDLLARIQKFAPLRDAEGNLH